MNSKLMQNYVLKNLDQTLYSQSIIFCFFKVDYFDDKKLKIKKMHKLNR